MARVLYERGTIGRFVRTCAAAAALPGLCAVAILACGAASAGAQGYNDPQYRPTPVRSGGGVLGFLFRDSGPQYRRRDPYASGGDYHYSPAPNAAAGYRTLCVRLCDGYYWPLSFSTGRAGLMRDAERCESSCDMPARLFYHYSSGSAETMIDLQGQPYSGMDHAFRYRTEYVADCKCRPDPWSEEAKQDYARRHEMAQEMALAENAAVTAAEQPVAQSAAPSQAGRVQVAPASAWQRQPQRRRVLETFNPFGRWFN